MSDVATPVPPPRTAEAADRPCELYEYHAPEPVQTEGHHIKPVYLQNRVYGRIVDGTIKYCCGNCHASVHRWLGWLLGEQRRPNPEPGRKAKAEAQRTFDWYTAARLEAMRGTHATHVHVAFNPDDTRG